MLMSINENGSLIDKETSPYMAEYLKNEAGQSVYSYVSNYASCAKQRKRRRNQLKSSLGVWRNAMDTIYHLVYYFWVLRFSVCIMK